MLLELKDLAQSLNAASVSVGQTDDHLVPYPNKPLFEIALDETGQVAAMRYVVRDEGPETKRFQRLRKYKCSKGGSQESTPGFNIDPLFLLRQGEDERAFRKELSSFRRPLRRGGCRRCPLGKRAWTSSLPDAIRTGRAGTRP